MEYEYDNYRDLLKFITDVCETNVSVDWREADPSKEFQFIANTITKYLNR